MDRPLVPFNDVSSISICFGHQSVGGNIVEALPIAYRGTLEIVETTDPAIYSRPVFGHFRVGKNGDPLSKCEAFAHVISSGVGKVVNVAFFKFCYVDIGRNTDVKHVFQNYYDTMASLEARYPTVMFLHVTVPLRRLQRGVRGWLRHMAGRPDGVLDDQLQRHRYNQLLREAYARSGRLFDLAEAEAGGVGGTPSFIRYNGCLIPNMSASYTDDGGHLNQSGAALMATKLLECLASSRGSRIEQGLSQ